MAKVKPLCGLKYNLSKLKPEEVIAPPYDVISEKGAQTLYERNPYNIIRLILTQPKLESCSPDERYARAKTYIEKWIQEDVLRKDKAEAFYLHEIEFEHPFQKRNMKRIAVYARVGVEPFERKVIFPHERTHASPKVDRGRLIRATHTNFSPVFFLHEDPKQEIVSLYGRYVTQKPSLEVHDDLKMRHRVWTVSDSNDVSRISDSFAGKRIFIADGHHRYETALNYAEELRASSKESDPAADYVLGAFVAFNDPGLLILPIHRLIRKSVAFDKQVLLEGLKRHFVLHSVSKDLIRKVSEGSVKEGFGLAFSEKECFVLELKDETSARKHMPAGKPASWYHMDVNLLSSLAIEPILHIQSSDLEHHVTYTADFEECFDSLKEGNAHCAFFIRPLVPLTIKDVCESGEVMPQKSTFFYPKFPSGLVMYRHL